MIVSFVCAVLFIVLALYFDKPELLFGMLLCLIGAIISANCPFVIGQTELSVHIVDNVPFILHKKTFIKVHDHIKDFVKEGDIIIVEKQYAWDHAEVESKFSLKGK